MKTQARRRFLGFTRKDLFELAVCILLSGLFVLLSSGKAFSQGNVGINNPTPHAKSLLDLTSSDKGLLAPRMTAAQRTAMFPGADATAKGMLVYQTDGVQGFYYYDGAAWVMVQSGNAGWGLLGNAGTNPTTNFLGTTDNQGLAIRTDNTERVRIAPNGEVTVGDAVSWPGYRLGVIANSINPAGAFQNTNATGYSGLHFINNTGVARAHIGTGNASSPNWVNMGYAGTYTAHPFVLTTSDLERMRIAANGNVGIGTTAPASKLHVSRSSSGLTPNGNATATLEASGANYQHFLTNTGESGLLFGSAGSSITGGFLHNTANAQAGFEWRTGGNVTRMIFSNTGDLTIGDNYIWSGTKLGVVNTNTEATIGTKCTNAAGFSGMYSVDNANTGAFVTGMGTSGHAYGSAGVSGTATAHPFTLLTSNVERMRIAVNGNVGIGTNAPARLLEVASSVQGVQRISSANTVSGSVLELRNTTAGNNILGGINFMDGTATRGQLAYHLANGMLFNTAGAERMRVDLNGNVGIGTTTPGSKLHVSRGASGLVPHALAAAAVESAGNTYQHFLTPGNSESGLLFGSGATAVDAGVLYHTAASLNGLDFRSGGNLTRMVIKSNGLVGIGTTAPAAELEVNGFTKHGSNAPAIKQIEFSGTTAATEGAYVDIPHGLTASKILDVRVLIEYNTGNWITTGHTLNGEYHADYAINAVNIRLYNHSTSSGLILSKPVKILVTYKA
ncbi:MAG: hypothetical protein WAT74_15710 [Flavobacteriales bacterium]